MPGGWFWGIITIALLFVHFYPLARIPSSVGVADSFPPQGEALFLVGAARLRSAEGGAPYGGGG